MHRTQQVAGSNGLVPPENSAAAGFPRCGLPASARVSSIERRTSRNVMRPAEFSAIRPARAAASAVRSSFETP